MKKNLKNILGDRIVGDLYMKVKSFLKENNKRLFLLKKMPRHSICAEVGVWRGEFSDKILSEINPQKLYLIDCWKFQPDFASEKSRKIAKDQEGYDAIYSEVKARLGSKKNVEIIRSYSSEAVKFIKDESLDWVYIDGNHLYEFVKQDLTLYYKKVKNGGFITGDDYSNSWEGVKKAVDEFVTQGFAKVIIIDKEQGQYILQKI